jgi:hypothetical protein
MISISSLFLEFVNIATTDPRSPVATRNNYAQERINTLEQAFKSGNLSAPQYNMQRKEYLKQMQTKKTTQGLYLN